MWNIVIVDGGGKSRTFKYKKTPGADSYGLSDAIYQALHTTGLQGVTSVTATII